MSCRDDEVQIKSSEFPSPGRIISWDWFSVWVWCWGNRTRDWWKSVLSALKSTLMKLHECRVVVFILRPTSFQAFKRVHRDGVNWIKSSITARFPYSSLCNTLTSCVCVLYLQAVHPDHCDTQHSVFPAPMLTLSGRNAAVLQNISSDLVNSVMEKHSEIRSRKSIILLGLWQDATSCCKTQRH